MLNVLRTSTATLQPARSRLIPEGTLSPSQNHLRVLNPLASLSPSKSSHSMSTSNPPASFLDVGHPELAADLESATRSILGWISPGQLPVVYSDRYNIRFYGVEKLHPFDSCKFQKVVNAVEAGGAFKKSQLVEPKQASEELLADVHTPEYLEAMLKSKTRIASVTELAPLALLPLSVLQQRLVNPMKCHVGGTMLAASLALTKGWAINVGGGMHHAHNCDGGGWCPFDDIMLAVRHVRRATAGKVQKLLVIDVDAHQGNGVERDKLHFNDQDLYMLDVYNCEAYPGDTFAKAAITIDVPLKPGTRDEEYLAQLQQALDKAASLDAQAVIFNAGTDPLDTDPLGYLKVSPEGIVKRDQMVWEWALQHKLPIVMVLSGGYARNSAAVISSSILNLFNKFNLADSAHEPLASQPAA